MLKKSNQNNLGPEYIKPLEHTHEIIQAIKEAEKEEAKQSTTRIANLIKYHSLYSDNEKKLNKQRLDNEVSVVNKRMKLYQEHIKDEKEQDAELYNRRIGDAKELEDIMSEMLTERQEREQAINKVMSERLKAEQNHKELMHDYETGRLQYEMELEAHEKSRAEYMKSQNELLKSNAALEIANTSSDNANKSNVVEARKDYLQKKEDLSKSAEVAVKARNKSIEAEEIKESAESNLNQAKKDLEDSKLTGDPKKIAEAAKKVKNLQAYYEGASKAFVTAKENERKAEEKSKKVADELTEARKNLTAKEEEAGQHYTDLIDSYTAETNELIAENNKKEAAFKDKASVMQNKDLVNARYEANKKSDIEDIKKQMLDALEAHGVATTEKTEAVLQEQAEIQYNAQKNASDRQEAQARANNLKSAFDPSNNTSLDEKLDALNKTFVDSNGNISAELLADFAQTLNASIETIASHKSEFDTAMQGSRGTVLGGAGAWEEVSAVITGIAGLSPFVKLEDVEDKAMELVKSGITFNVAQRAYYATMSSKIAATFEATNGTLLRLVRIQGQDSTAARLGMESLMTSFLNNMYENSEYLQSVAKSVKSNLEEAMSLMTASDAIGFEYSVQKWLGSYYSVGMSDDAISSLSSNLGKIAAGQIEGITGGGTGNLLIMGANQANLPIDQILANGLDESTTNDLLQGVSEYLHEIVDLSSDNLVVQQQIADVYGMTASDLKAIANLYNDDGKTISNIYNSSGDYTDSMRQLIYMESTMALRTSMGEMMNNMYENAVYSISAGIAQSPALYTIYKFANLLKGVTGGDESGGLNLPFLNVMGFGVDLNTTVANLMLAGSMVGGIASTLTKMAVGGVVSAASNLAALSGGNVMNTVSRGTGGGIGTTVRGGSTSQSGATAGASGNDAITKTQDDASEDSDDTLQEAKDENEEATTTMINDNIIEILNLIKDVVDNEKQIHVKVDDYGLTGWN